MSQGVVGPPERVRGDHFLGSLARPSLGRELVREDTP